MLLNRQVVKATIELWAHADEGLDDRHLCLRVVTANGGNPTTPLKSPSKNGQGRGLAGAIRAKQPEDFPFCNAQRKLRGAWK